jgi:hypothetical protein
VGSVLLRSRIRVERSFNPFLPLFPPLFYVEAIMMHRDIVGDCVAVHCYF